MRSSSFTVIVIFVCLSLVGLALLPLLPVKLNPSHNLPSFTVSFSMPGASSRVVEQEATCKLEAMLSRIRGVRKISSTSGNGSGKITVELDKHADIDNARFEAATVIRQTWPELPSSVKYPTISMRASDKEASRPFMTFTLNAPSAPIVIQQYAEEHIKPTIAGISGVDRVDISGATPMEWRLEYDAIQLRQLGITVGDITSAVKQHFSRTFLGTHDVTNDEAGRQWIRIVLQQEHGDVESDLTSIIVKKSGNKVIRLGELVSVTHVEEEPQSYYRINGLNSIYMSVTADAAANQLQLNKEIVKAVNDIKVSLPAGYEIYVYYDATEYIREELSKIYFRTALTVCILLVFVWLITRRLKYLFLIICTLAVNVAVAFIFYYLFGLELQLYSLAGITISLNLVIDSMIVMTNHILLRHNLKAFLSVLAATLTTIGSLVIIFFLEEKIRLNLQDFAAVVIINMIVSLVVALFFVPALIDKLGMDDAEHGKKMKTALKRTTCFMRRLAVRFSHVYEKLIIRLCRYRWAVCLLLLLGFGLPVFLLPEKNDGDSWAATHYNKMFDSDTYREKVKPVTDKLLGGTLRLFVEKVYNGSYFTRNEEVTLQANANLPNGSTLDQMNTLIKQMEHYLSGFSGIRQFHTTIFSAQRASIQIYFKKEVQGGSFPYQLKAGMVGRALELGGGSWSIYGLEDMGFNNDVRENAGSYGIIMHGYNYDELYSLAEKLKSRLLEHRRIKDVIIKSEFSWWKDDYREFYFDIDRERMAVDSLDAYTVYSAVQPIFGRDMNVTSVGGSNGLENVTLSSRQSHEYDIWSMQHVPYTVGGNGSEKMSEIASVEKEQAPQQVAKENQQYKLCLQYEYIGSSDIGEKVQEKVIDEFRELLPMGYTVTSRDKSFGWKKKDKGQYLLLVIVIAIIFFITSILFNSLKQPFAIIFVIPVSYIGVFLAFYWFHLNFDQGGFASFILLCGITVNAGIYIVNEYNGIRNRYRNLSPVRAYIKAWNVKIMTIFLTVVSTIFGFVPFMIGDSKEAFWFPLSAGTIGGLVMSMLGVFIFLPIFVLPRRKR
jgi:multidrug efflux pump subunit AcrB